MFYRLVQSLVLMVLCLAVVALVVWMSTWPLPLLIAIAAIVIVFVTRKVQT